MCHVYFLRAMVASTILCHRTSIFVRIYGACTLQVRFPLHPNSQFGQFSNYIKYRRLCNLGNGCCWIITGKCETRRTDVPRFSFRQVLIALWSFVDTDPFCASPPRHSYRISFPILEYLQTLPLQNKSRQIGDVTDNNSGKRAYRLLRCIAYQSYSLHEVWGYPCNTNRNKSTSHLLRACVRPTTI